MAKSQRFRRPEARCRYSMVTYVRWIPQPLLLSPLYKTRPRKRASTRDADAESLAKSDVARFPSLDVHVAGKTTSCQMHAVLRTCCVTDHPCLQCSWLPNHGYHNSTRGGLCWSEGPKRPTILVGGNRGRQRSPWTITTCPYISNDLAIIH